MIDFRTFGTRKGCESNRELSVNSEETSVVCGARAGKWGGARGGGGREGGWIVRGKSPFSIYRMDNKV